MSVKIDINKIQKKITKNFEKRFINKKGFISRTYPISNRSIIDNFDDIIPFLEYFNEKEIIFSQLNLLENSSYEKELSIGGIIYSYKIDEYLGGLNNIYKNLNSEKAKCLLDNAIYKTKNYFIKNNNIYDIYDLQKQKRSNFYSSWSSGLLETFLEIDTDKFKRNENISLVEPILKNWLNDNFYKKYNIFPFRSSTIKSYYLIEEINNKFKRYCLEYPSRITERKNLFKKFLFDTEIIFKLKTLSNRFLNSGHWAQLMKSNTTPVFTMIELYRLTNNEYWEREISSWIDSAVDKFTDAKFTPYSYWYTSNKKRTPSLVAGFILIDVLCDSFMFVKKEQKWIDIASKISQQCLRWSWANHLIPMSPNMKFNHIDNQVDFSISIRKLSEIIGNNKLRNQSFKIMEAVLNLQNSEDGFYTHIYENGQNKYIGENNIDPKYNGLLLKGLIHLLEKDKNIYDNEKLIDLFKDR